jgi:hypothetical protein
MTIPPAPAPRPSAPPSRRRSARPLSLASWSVRRRTRRGLRARHPGDDDPPDQRGGRGTRPFYFAVLRGEAIPLPGLGRTQRPTLDQRLTAAQWLGDRGWGRAREIIQLAGEATAEERLAILKRLTEAERETLRTILTRALDAPATAPPVCLLLTPSASSPLTFGRPDR